MIGNNKTVFSIIGANNHSIKDREINDYYATDSIAIDAFLEKAILSNDKIIKQEEYEIKIYQTRNPLPDDQWQKCHYGLWNGRPITIC